jgi:rod shape-determining protein MreB
VRVHSSEIREAVQEPIQQIVDAVRRALEITPPSSRATSSTAASS